MGDNVVKHRSSNLLKFPMIVDYVEEKQETPALEEVHEPQRSNKRRIRSFKQMANLIRAANCRWTKNTNNVSDKSKNFATNQDEEKLTFNVSAFRSDVRSLGDLDPEVKNALMKGSWQRTPKDINLIETLVNRIKAFESYSKDLKKELTRILIYQSFGSGRVILQQGHVGVSFYFIISGTVTVQREEKDDRTGEKHIQHLTELAEGDAFGELALLQNSTRTATIVCKTRCEFLKIDKEDYNQVLKNSQKVELEKKMSIFCEHPYFKNWSEQAKRAATANSKIRDFPANKIILHKRNSNQDYVHFVRYGRCKVVREITVKKTLLPFGRNRLSLVTHKKPQEKRSNCTFEKRYLVIAWITKGGYFGIGEDLENTYIISDGKVRCLLVPRITFMKHNSGRDLSILRDNLTATFPDIKEAFKSFLREQNWNNYRQNLIDDLVKKRCKPLDTKFDDVPGVIRRDHEQYIRKI